MKKKIFFIDDNKDILRTVKLIIEKKTDYFIKTFSDSVEGFNAICDDKPDLVFLDVMMPQMDGIEVAKKIRKKCGIKKVQIVFITVRTDEEMSKAAKEYVNYIIEKPFEIETILEVTRQAFGEMKK